MDTYTAKICPKCNGAINPGDNATVCPACGVEHHLNCWIANQGCAVPTCPGKQPAAPVAPVAEPVAPVVEPVAPVAPVAEPVAPAQPAYQPPVQPGYQPPVQPGYQQPPVQAGPSVCTACGTPVTGAFCPKCGTPVSAPAAPGAVNPAVAQYNATVAAPKKKKTGLIIGIIAAVVVVILIIALAGGDSGSGGGGLLSTGPNLTSMYNQYCESTWADIASDGSYLKIDTNPYDWDDDGVAYTDAYYAIEDVNAALGLPDSLFEEMGSTRGMDGKQTRTYSDKNLEVSWSYHPDEGLEVTYRKIR